MKENDVRETAPQLWQPLHEEFRFTLDVAADERNALCERFCTQFGTCYEPGTDLHDWDERDGLLYPWEGESVWCNPPFSDIYPWICKAWGEFRSARSIVMLVPANRTEQAWWQKGVAPFVKANEFSVRWPAKRQHFLVNGEPCWKRDKAGELILTKKGKKQRSSPKFACALVIWRP